MTDAELAKPRGTSDLTGTELANIRTANKRKKRAGARKITTRTMIAQKDPPAKAAN